ncbi:MAG: Glu-tRNA(Gln) amidotransferase subunit GatE [Candidatus Micrarchaeota archaeon]
MDYSDLGFKCGIEIHQRLSTKKLFCDCYCDPNKQAEMPQKEVLIHRKLRAVIGELGKIDPAAAFEATKAKKFTYLFDDAYSCYVELDEEPPHKMNQEALLLGLVVSQSLGSRPVDDVFIMRKTVIDGSAVSGFQRTALLSLNGKLSTSKGEVQIPTLALEEESSGIIEKKGGETIYRLDRLGIPLIEIATDPSIKDGAHAMEVAEKIGMILRSTGKVQRGLGSIRQDLNVSISKGARIEIKGVQDLKLIPTLVDNEVNRQIGLLKIREEIRSRHILLGEEHFSTKEVTDLFSSTGSKLIKDALLRKEKVFALKIQSFSGLFKTQLMPSHPLGSEIASYVRAHSQAKGIIHSDENLVEKYSLGNSQIDALGSFMGLSQNDLLILCIGSEEICKKALRAAFNRCLQLQVGIPEETRRAEGEISIFMRPLPGSARMYPETDLLPIQVTEAMLKEATDAQPESPEAKKAKYLKWGLNLQLAQNMLRSPEWVRFEALVEKSKAPPQIVALTLLETLISLKRSGGDIAKLTDEDLLSALSLLADSKITKSAIPELLKIKCLSGTEALSDLASSKNILRISGAELSKLVSQISGSNEKKFAEIMRTHRLRVDAQELQKTLDGN